MAQTINVTLPDDSIAEVPIDENEIDVPGVGVVVVHANKARAGQIDFRRDQPVIAAMTRSYAEEIQELENAIWQVLLSRYVDHAFGHSLDLIGRRVGEGREGQSNDYYRVRVKARILINASRGLREDVLKVARALGLTARIRNTGRATFSIAIDEVPETLATAAQAHALLTESASAGVGVSTAIATNTARALRWSSASDPTIGGKFGSTSDPTIGGLMYDGRTNDV